MIHSLPVDPVVAPCRTVIRQPHPRLRGYVVAYSGFRTAAPIPHRLPAMNIPALVIDVTGAGRVVTGARAGPAVARDVRWGEGVTAGLTPAGVEALLGIPMRDLTGLTVPLDLIPAAPAAPASAAPPGLASAAPAELAERLAATSGWDDRFALLDDWLTARLRPAAPDALVTAAWWRLQRGPARVGAVAAGLGVSRRRLESGFQRRIGLPPGTVARVARFQRAMSMLAAGAALPRAAADAGYADQPHLTREVRGMAGLTPAELRDVLSAAAPSFKTAGTPRR